MSRCYSHRLTPPCPEHVPRRDWLKLYVPSRQRADAPAGGPLGLLHGEGTHRPREFTYPLEPHSALERAEGRLREVPGVERAEGRVGER